MAAKVDNFRWEQGAVGFISVKGRRLECTSFGPDPAEAPTIVMLHEGLGCVSMWRDFPRKLAEETGYGVFAYSRSGYGQSDPCELPRPVGYMSVEAMDVLPQVLDSIGFRSGILLGHSDGATISAIYGGMSGDLKVRGLVLMAPHFFTEPLGLASIAKAGKAFNHGDLREKLARYHADVDCAFRGWNDAWLDPNFVDWNVSEVIDYLRIPVLAIQGRDDEYGTLAQIEEIESRIYSPLEVELLEGCGHSPHREFENETMSLVSDFAARLRRIENTKVPTS